MSLVNITPLLLILAVGFTAVNSMSFFPFRRDESESCGEDLFEIMKELRDNEMATAVIAGVGFELSENNAELANLACQVVEASTIEELASVLKLSAQDLETKLRDLKAKSPKAIEFIRFYEVEFTKLRSWLVDSGFPDTWPLKTVYDENLDFLQTCEIQHLVTFETKKAPTEVARILTESMSFEGFREALEVDTSKVSLKRIVKRLRYLATEQAGLDITNAAQAGVQFIEAVLNLQVVKALGQ